IFPVDSDEQAIDVKKKIKAILGENPDAMFNFNIGSMILPPVSGVKNGGLGR
ncbi:unnamed protein product, partial [marine sediment metagenome]